MKGLAVGTLFFFTYAMTATPALAQQRQTSTQSQAQTQLGALRNTPRFTVPLAGSGGGATFAGTFAFQKFANDAGKVVALGTITGIVTQASGATTAIVRNVQLPVSIGDVATTSAAPAIAPRATCPILHLDLGPLFLDVLGLQIDLSRIILDITAVSGAGNLLGNLLCAVLGLLDDPSGLAALLNAILDVISGNGLLDLVG